MSKNMTDNAEKEQKNSSAKAENESDVKNKPDEKNKGKSNDENKKDSEDKKTANEIENLKKELEETKNKYLVMLAEYDNFRKRSQKEREGTYSEAYADAIKTLLPVFDNIERANSFTDSKGIAEGLAMILNQFTASLGKLGIEEFGKVGENFDPNIHNAIMNVTDETLGENVIAEVLQKGYKRGDKIIRFAMVKVANCS